VIATRHDRRAPARPVPPPAPPARRCSERHAGRHEPPRMGTAPARPGAAGLNRHALSRRPSHVTCGPARWLRGRRCRATQLATAASGSGVSQCTRRVPSRRARTRPAARRTCRCLLTAGRLMSKLAASSATGALPARRRSRIARRVGSARAWKTSGRVRVRGMEGMMSGLEAMESAGPVRAPVRGAAAAWVSIAAPRPAWSRRCHGQHLAVVNGGSGVTNGTRSPPRAAGAHAGASRNVGVQLGVRGLRSADGPAYR